MSLLGESPPSEMDPGVMRTSLAELLLGDNETSLCAENDTSAACLLTHQLFNLTTITPLEPSVTSTTSEVRTEDLYCDDELNGDDPNLQLQIAQAASEQAAAAGDSAAHGANSGGMRSRYPPHPMLVDQG